MQWRNKMKIQIEMELNKVVSTKENIPREQNYGKT